MREINKLFLILILLCCLKTALTAQCAGPPEIIPYKILADNIQLIWESGDPTLYAVEIGVSGFVQGSGTRVGATDTSVVISNLVPKTLYDIYLYSACANGMIDSIGPLVVETIFYDDVGITLLDAPLTGCDLTNTENITISITNFGQNPHTLFDFGYSLEDIEGNVSRPFDGLYTGIVGFDSTVMTTFDVKADVGFPGEYKFKVWTALTDDQDMDNDTFEIVITHQPVIDAYPYEWDFEQWKGGWLIDESQTTNTSMEYGRPNSPVILSAASGSKAWVTNLIGDYNTSEKTVLISPCFDFSGMTNDPYVSFALIFEGEACCDFATAEISINAGRNWTKIGDGENGINWYNNNNENRWDGNGVGQGWSRVQNRLFGAAGRDSVRIRYVFESDASTQGAGIGIDDIHIYEPYVVDAAVAVVDHTSSIECGETNDQVTIAIENAGLSDISSFIVSYSLNGAAAVTETITQTLAPEERDTFILSSTINTATDGVYNLKAWVAAPGDAYSNNDTLSVEFEIKGVTALPISEDFEDTDFPPGWQSTDMTFGIDHNSPSSVYYGRLNSSATIFELYSPNVGQISSTDTLEFDYRIIEAPNGNSATILGVGNMLEVQASTDCGLSYSTVLTINNSNHITTTNMSTQKVPLLAFANMDIKIRFKGSHANGDYFVDIDNIIISACPVSLALSTEQADASSVSSADGAITVIANQGTPGYIYAWSNGGSNATNDNLIPADYTATVTDANGCVDQITVSLGSCNGLGLTINKTNESPSGNDGTAMAQASTGTAPYSYMWETGVTTDMIWDLSLGNYSVTVTDANGCQETIEAVIDLETAINTISDLEVFKIFPNPANEILNVQFEIETARAAHIQMFNSVGQLISDHYSGAQSMHEVSLSVSNLVNGIYLVRIVVGSDVITRRFIVNH